jgi:hypothetical protein
MADSWPYTELGEPVNPEEACIITCKAGGTISKGQVVAISAAFAVPDGPTVTAWSSGAAFGVATRDASSGDSVPVLVYGLVKVTAGGSVSAGARLEPGTGGKVVTLSSGVEIGRAMTGASADGDTLLIWVRL